MICVCEIMNIRNSIAQEFQSKKLNFEFYLCHFLFCGVRTNYLTSKLQCVLKCRFQFSGSGVDLDSTFLTSSQVVLIWLLCKTHSEQQEHKVLHQVICIRYLAQCQVCACAINLLLQCLCAYTLSNKQRQYSKVLQVDKQADESLNTDMCGTFICKTCP